METRLIHDDAGEWLINTASFPLHDPETGCTFKPRTPTKAVLSDWAKGQPVIKPFVTEEKAEALLATSDTQVLATAQVASLTTAEVAALTTAQVGTLSSVELPKVR